MSRPYTSQNCIKFPLAFARKMNMIVLFVVSVLLLAVLIARHGRSRMSRFTKLRRIHAGVFQKAEWMAPDTVLLQVRSDYLGALQWLQDSALKDWTHRLTHAPLYLSGMFLKRHQHVLKKSTTLQGPQCIGILRADHQVDVRYFSEDGERCLVIDNQTQRRMATYDLASRERVHTQDLGSCVMVYQMVYDTHARRWKIDAFIQELPQGWGSPNIARHIRVQAHLRAPAGRDN